MIEIGDAVGFKRVSVDSQSHQVSGKLRVVQVAKLIHRCKEGQRLDKYCIKSSIFWVAPKSLMEAIKVRLGATQERFACPLNCDTSYQPYYSPFAHDTQFGAQHDAYSCRWTGSSQANLDCTAKEMQKAVRWAISSAMDQNEPSLTAFVMPFHHKTGKIHNGRPKCDYLFFIVANPLEFANSWHPMLLQVRCKG